MTRTIIGTVFAFVVCSAAFGQSAEPPLVFEVASVKAAPPPAGGGGMHGCFGGPGTSNPGLYTCSKATVSLMAFQAYGLKSYQVGPAYYSDTVEYNVTAKVPPGTTPTQLRTMMQSLLTERFKLTFHYEKKEVAVYDLVVAKGGPKFQEASPTPEPEPSTAPPVPQRQLSKDEDGFPILPRRPRSMSFPSANGLGRIVSSAMPISSLASYLTQRMGRPVFDATGLNGKYDYTVTFTQESLPVGGPPPRPDDASGLTIFAALEKQLGLRLESKKSIIDIFVIDHWEKTPVEN